MTYVRNGSTGDSLHIRPLDGGPDRELLSETQFVSIVEPRYGPDGASIAFAGVVDRPLMSPKLLGRSVVNGGAPGPTSTRGVDGHGIPSDAYTVPTAGGDAKLEALLSYDDLALCWSPDGAWLAVSAAAGLKLVRVSDGMLQPVTDNGSFGPIDWR